MNAALFLQMVAVSCFCLAEKKKTKEEVEEGGGGGRFTICKDVWLITGLLFSARAVSPWHNMWVIRAKKGNHKFPLSGENPLYCPYDEWAPAPDTKILGIPLKREHISATIIHDI